MRSEYDVIIIGGGPAGLAAAEALAKYNKNVLLLEKNNEIGPKICGGGLTAKATNLGIPLDIADKTFSSFLAHTSKNVYTRSMPNFFMSTIDRKNLGQYMAKKTQASGAEILTKTKVDEISKEFINANGQQIKFKYLIGADGSLSLTRKYLSIPTKKMMISFQYLLPEVLPNLEIFVDAKTFGSGYGWIFPHKHFTSIGIYMDKDELRGHNLKDLCTAWCQKIKINLSKAKQESWIINCDYRGWKFDNIFLVGDAGGFASGLTGEGIYYAIISGLEAAKKIINPNYQAKQIKSILKKKKNHERFLKILQINKKMPDLIYNIIIPFSKPQFLTNKIMSFFFE